MSNQNLPPIAPRAPNPLDQGGLRQVMGNRARLAPGRSSQVIDYEAPSPRPFLLVVQAVNAISPAVGTLATVTIRTGVDRAHTEDETFECSGCSRVILARTVQAVVANAPEGATYVAAEVLDVRAVLVPLDIAVDPRIFGASITSNDVPSLDTLVDPIDGTPRSQLTQFGASLGTTSFGLAHKGMAITNDSSAFLYVAIGNAVSTTSYTKRLAPGEYWEVPFGWSGQVVGIWDAAVGQALVTRIFS
jgi:hypothetical protein